MYNFCKANDGLLIGQCSLCLCMQHNVALNLVGAHDLTNFLKGTLLAYLSTYRVGQVAKLPLPSPPQWRWALQQQQQPQHSFPHCLRTSRIAVQHVQAISRPVEVYLTVSWPPS